MVTKPFISTGNLGYGITKHGCTCPCGVVAYFREGQRFDSLAEALEEVKSDLDLSLEKFSYSQAKTPRTLRASLAEVNLMIAEEETND